MSKRLPEAPAKRPPLPRPRRIQLAIGTVVAAVALGLGGWIFADWYVAIPQEAKAKYVGRNSCAQCHPGETHAFAGSHHDLAMDRATPETVLGDFDDARFEHHGIVSRFFKKGDEYWVNTEGPTGEMQDFRIDYVFGVDPLQQYMVEFGRDRDAPKDELPRVQVLRISWDTQKKKWFYLPPPDVPEKIAPEDDLHWTGIAQRWNVMCADCHSTNLHKNFDERTGQYHTTFSEIDVSCEACHGPGSLHVDLAENKTFFWDRERGYALAQLKGKDTEPQIQSCAPCHSRRQAVCPDWQAGENYFDCFAGELLNDRTYHVDGQVEDEVYEFGSFLQSKMYHKGIRCTDCHEPHTAKLKHEGNHLCTSCHQHPAGKYDSPSHHFHKPGSPGASCVECHMPETTYMEVDPRRDHSIRVPRPELSLEFGTPNACSRCHLEEEKVSPEAREGLKQYGDWVVSAREGNEEIAEELKRLDGEMAAAVAKWYPQSDQQPVQRRVAEAFTLARTEQPGAEQALFDLAERADVPAIVRATALSQAAYLATPERRNEVRDLLKSSDPQVRRAAVGMYEPWIPSLGGYPLAPEQVSALADNLQPFVDDLLPLLDDPVRTVRIEAARVLARVPTSVRMRVASGPERQKIEAGIEEFRKAMLVNNDRAGAYLALGSLEEQLGNDEQAEKYYRTAMQVEPTTTGPRANLASLLEQRGELAAAEARHVQQQGNTQRYTELMRRREELIDEAEPLRAEELKLLERDARLAPEIGAVQYRFGLALYLAERMEDAEAALQKAVDLEPRNAAFLSALALLLERLEKYQEAAAVADRLVDLGPENVESLEIRDRIRAQLTVGPPE